ncbi:MAG TPA: FAD-dependent oxidoreductase, partial [candidate division WOR-3 bacterium]|nr:FAD-dependent oxidoreductase [candidate division WOR-3 bacterium]
MKTLIIGSGIAGITSAIDLAGAGIDVILLEKENFITGRLAQLDRQFPNDACGMCQVYP